MIHPKDPRRFITLPSKDLLVSSDEGGVVCDPRGGLELSTGQVIRSRMYTHNKKRTTLGHENKGSF